MFYTTRRSRQNILFFLLMLAFTECMNFGARKMGLDQYNPATELFEAMIIAWGLTAHRRILQREIRHALMGGALFLLVLFVNRTLRYDLFYGVIPDEAMFCAHYVSLVFIPVMSLIAAAYVDRTQEELPRRRFYPVWGALLAMCVLILTNSRHHLFLAYSGQDGLDQRRIGDLLFVLWIVILTAVSFAVLLHKCALSGCRKLWYVPMLPVAAAVSLMIWYGVNGGSPHVFGVKVFLVQEVYALFFIGFWEGCIQIGLIPTNTGYDALLSIASTGAVLVEGEEELSEDEERLRVPGPADRDSVRIRSHKVSGGRVLWAEDISVVQHLNEELEDAAQRIEEENILLAEENRIRSEQAALEVQNRLYDRIAVILRPQMGSIESLLGDGSHSDFRRRVALSAVLGAYAKRRANLELLADTASSLQSEDLYYALKESSEYLELSGVSLRLAAEGSRRIPSGLIILAYDLFEEVTEQSLPGLSYLLTVLDCTQGLSLRMVLSPASEVVLPAKLTRRAEECSALVRMTEEDGELNVSFNADTALVLQTWSPPAEPYSPLREIAPAAAKDARTALSAPGAAGRGEAYA